MRDVTEVGLKEDNTAKRAAWRSKINSCIQNMYRQPHMMGDNLVYFILSFHLGFSMSTYPAFSSEMLCSSS